LQTYSSLPLIGLLLLVAIVFWRRWLHRRRYGASGIWLFRSGSAGLKLRDAAAVALVVLAFGQAVVAAGWLQALPLSQADREASAAIRHTAGAVLLFVALVLLVIAQLNLGASWRVGIEEGARPGLITGGLYRWSRNPIFLALLVFLAGYTLLLPTLLSALMLAGAYLGVRQQIAAEEAYLAQTYGAEFREYARRVGRLIPGIGKLDPE
jgi:protein-S-isoprenylcysteine O-methyltransferase Ste14